jgi:hypothetical protein
MWVAELRIENAALLTQIEELQIATVIIPPSAHLPNASALYCYNLTRVPGIF